MEDTVAGGEKRGAREQGGKGAGRQGSTRWMPPGEMFSNVLHFFSALKVVLKQNKYNSKTVGINPLCPCVNLCANQTKCQRTPTATSSCQADQCAIRALRFSKTLSPDWNKRDQCLGQMLAMPLKKAVCAGSR